MWVWKSISPINPRNLRLSEVRGRRLLRKKTIFYKVHPRAFGVQESNSTIHFLKSFVILRFEGRVLRKKIMTALWNKLSVIWDMMCFCSQEHLDALFWIPTLYPTSEFSLPFVYLVINIHYYFLDCREGHMK